MDIRDYMFEILRLTLLNQRESEGRTSNYHLLLMSIVLVSHFNMLCVRGFYFVATVELITSPWSFSPGGLPGCRAAEAQADGFVFGHEEARRGQPAGGRGG